MALIFVVDARSGVTDLSRTVLVGRGHRVKAFARLDEALRLVKTQAPDAILLSPERTPAEIISTVRRASANTLTFFLIPNRDDERSMLAALDAGAADVILTPMVPAELAARVAAALRKAARQRARRKAEEKRESSRRIRKAQLDPRGSARRRAGQTSVTPPRAQPEPEVLASGELSARGVLANALGGMDDKLKGRIFDRYRLVRTLGVGGMGVVIEALHRETGIKCALKVLRADLADEPEAPLRFLREAYVLQGLQSEHIVALSDIGRAGGTHFYAMEFVEGATLAQLLDQNERLPIPEACRIAEGVARGLAILSGAGIVHRDIKPGNIFVGRDKVTVKLGDFGLAKRANARDVTPRKSLIGTPHYIAPEVIAGEPAHAGSDLYAIGVCLHEMLCGQPLHNDEPTASLLHQIVYGPPPDISQTLRGFPAEVQEVVDLATRRYPEQRFADAGRLADALAHLRRTRRPSISRRRPTHG